jgi:hypothetical protein
MKVSAENLKVFQEVIQYSRSLVVPRKPPLRKKKNAQGA